MKNFFKIILLLIILLFGFLVFKSFQNKSHTEDHKEVIDNKEDANDVKNNEIDNEFNTTLEDNNLDQNKIDEINDKKENEIKEIDSVKEKKIKNDIEIEDGVKKDSIEVKSIDDVESNEEVKDHSAQKNFTKSNISVFNGSDVYLGNKNAKIVMIEYDSLTCPHCKVFSEEIFPKIKKEYIDTGKVLYVTRPFPTDGISFRLSLMIECSDNNDDKLKLRSIVFSNQGKIEENFRSVNFKDQSEENKALIDKKARSLIDSMVDSFIAAGFDGEALKKCGTPESKDEKTQTLVKKILDDSKKAYESGYKIEATPAFLINGKKYDGAQNLKYWKDILDHELSLIPVESIIENNKVTQDNGEILTEDSNTTSKEEYDID
jgi:protein-disulfide isomerase